MTCSSMKAAAVVVLVFSAFPLAAQQHEHRASAGEDVGRVVFPSSCDAAVQPDLERAVAMLHSFWYEKAEEAFNRITSKAPECGMAYWGAAMSVFRPLWQPSSPAELQRGATAAARALAAKQTSAREHAYARAIGAFYEKSATVSHATRVLAYETAMAAVYTTYPRDDEAAAFYALAMLGAAAVSSSDTMFVRQKRAAALLNGVAARHPRHPGITHYFIHAYDSPALASLALPAARTYAAIAPSVPHALHMPSHIFTRMGRWDEAIASDLASAKAARAYAESTAMPGVWDQELHALDYLVYAYLQGAQDRRAALVLERITGVTQAEPPVQAAAHALATAPARFALERHDWRAAVALKLAQTNVRWENYRWSESNVYYAVALGAARTGNLPRAREEITRLEKMYQELQGKDKYAGLIDAQRRAASAWVAEAEGRSGEALMLLRSAADLEESIEKHPVTPGMLLPARELLGDLLLAQAQPAEALKAYEATLKHSPRRFNSIAGAMRAAERSGARAVALRYARALLELSANADSPRPEISEAKRLTADGRSLDR